MDQMSVLKLPLCYSRSVRIHRHGVFGFALAVTHKKPVKIEMQPFQVTFLDSLPAESLVHHKC